MYVTSRIKCDTGYDYAAIYKILFGGRLLLLLFKK